MDSNFKKFKKQLSNRLDALPHHLRVAFACGSTQRVLRIYETEYNMEDKRLHKAIDILWQYIINQSIRNLCNPPKRIGSYKNFKYVVREKYEI